MLINYSKTSQTYSVSMDSQVDAVSLIGPVDDGHPADLGVKGEELDVDWTVRLPLEGRRPVHNPIIPHIHTETHGFGQRHFLRLQYAG